MLFHMFGDHGSERAVAQASGAVGSRASETQGAEALHAVVAAARAAR